MEKKSVAVLGGGGYIGALAFGYLQRCMALYPTGISRSCRVIGASAETSIRLNRVLGGKFTLAVADESFIKLTDLTRSTAIQERLDTVDALIIGDAFSLQQRSVTPNTYEKTPNDKAWEFYLDDFTGDISENEMKLGRDIIANALQAASNTVQHVFAIKTNAKSDEFFVKELENCGIPFTCLCVPTLERRPASFTYREGVRNNFRVESYPDWESTKNAIQIQSVDSRAFTEDVTALLIQAIQSLDWRETRFLKIDALDSEVSFQSKSRPDQQFIVNSQVLEKALYSAMKK